MIDPNKWALLVGIDDYPNAPKLRAAVNDAQFMAELLQSGFGFPAEHTLVLRDAAATRDGLLAAVEQLGERVQDDDAVVFFYSGHGGHLPDPTGRWPKGLASTLLPFDVEADGTGQITYDELCERLLQRMAARPYLTLIIDTSYAGSIGPCLDADPHLRERTVFLGACRTEEAAIDTYLENVPHGAFTYTLGQALVSAGPDATYRQVFEQVSSQVSARFPQQHPQMEGEGDRRLFGAGKVESMHFVPVVGRTRKTATLGAGAALGMTAGSTWAIYPPDTLKVTTDTPKRGLVEITKVSAVTSEANILSEAGVEAIAAGTKAMEETHHYGEMRLVVDVRAADGELMPLGDKLRKLFEESELVRTAQPDEQADVTAWLLEPRSAVQEGDPLPQLGALGETTWALVREKDLLMGLTYPAEDRSAVWKLRDTLERLARVRNVLNLRNPNMNSPLVGKVDLVLECQLADGTWAEAQPEVPSGMVVFEDGDEVRLIISNHHQAPLYVSVLDLTWHGTFSLIFPLSGPINEVEPGTRLETPSMRVSIPEERSKKAGADTESLATRVETVKLFATAYPYDFRALVRQEGMRGTESNIGETTMLWELLDMALTGYGSRRSRPVQLPAEQEWITVERSFALLRKGEKTWLR